MAANRIITAEELNHMKTIAPYVHRKNERQVKNQLLESIKDFYGDRWHLFSDATRASIDYYALRAAERGFVFHDSGKVGDLFGASKRTVRLRLDELVEEGILVKAYRRCKTNNGLGNIVFFFASHPYFEHWCDYLGIKPLNCQAKCQTDCQAGEGDYLTASKAEKPKKVSTLFLPSFTLNSLRERSEESLGYEFVRESVPKDFVMILKPFINQAKDIEEYWRMVELKTQNHDKLGYEFDFLPLAIRAFRAAIRKKNAENRIAYFTKTFDNMYKDACRKDAWNSILGDGLLSNA